jgi:hypothetical protein
VRLSDRPPRHALTRRAGFFRFLVQERIHMNKRIGRRFAIIAVFVVRVWVVCRAGCRARNIGSTLSTQKLSVLSLLPVLAAFDCC